MSPFAVAEIPLIVPIAGAAVHTPVAPQGLFFQAWRARAGRLGMGVILIAFERESEQSALETLLSGHGHRVLKSANGLAALDAARREPPQAIVSDIVLPRMDGFALCRKWKQDERLQSIPFVFYTRRHDDPKYERFALELGAERFPVALDPAGQTAVRAR